MNPDAITHFSDPEREYVKGVDAARTLNDLRAHLKQWRALAPDALAAVERMDEAAFAEFQKARRKERRGRFAGEEAIDRFGDILAPEILFRTALVAHQFHVPWGAAFIRLQEVGIIKVENSACRWNEVSRRAGDAS